MKNVEHTIITILILRDDLTAELLPDDEYDVLASILTELFL